MRTCTMLTGHSSDDPTPDVECGRPAAYLYRKDVEHYACAPCFSAMDDDIQAEYVSFEALTGGVS